MTPQFTLVETTDGEQYVTLFVPGKQPLVAGSSHPNYDRIKRALTSNAFRQIVSDDELVELFDLPKAVSSRFHQLTDRVTVRNGRVWYEDNPVPVSIERQILRFLDEGEDFKPLVAFLTNIQDNPNQHSRTQLHDWLDAHDFTITPGGHIVGYKGVVRRADGSLVSQWSGAAFVDGKRVEGQIPNEVGSTVEMPRGSVAHDPSTACSRGLHVGTYRYAKSYAKGAMLKVYVNPRDVVSVPTDAAGEKVRVSRYTVVDVIDGPVGTALDPDTLAVEGLEDDLFDAPTEKPWHIG